MSKLMISVAVGLLALMDVSAQSRPTLGQSTSSKQEIVLIASQPSAPVRIDSATLVSSPNHDKWTLRFELTNTGTKPVRRVIPGLWTSLATGGTLEPQPLTGDLQPGAVVKINSTQASHIGTPTSDPPAQTFPRVLFVLSIEEVTFADGTRYSDNSTSKALMKYFESITDKTAEARHPPTPKP
jgi:hypothetical protein